MVYAPAANGLLGDASCYLIATLYPRCAERRGQEGYLDSPPSRRSKPGLARSPFAPGLFAPDELAIAPHRLLQRRNILAGQQRQQVVFRQNVEVQRKQTLNI